MTQPTDRKTPEVAVSETDAFPPSIVGVATAVPIFIGYTETARNPSSGAPVYLEAVPIASMADYDSYFGRGYAARGVVGPQGAAADYDFEAFSNDGTATTQRKYRVGTAASASGLAITSSFNLFSAMQLFYANGGGNCFVVSVANYWGARTAASDPADEPAAVARQDLLDGLAIANETRGATMLVVPDACLLVKATASTETGAGTTTYSYPDYQPVACEMLRQAGTLQDRVAILDMPGALVAANWTPAAMTDEAEAFYASIAPAAGHFSYGACYGPALESSLLGKADLGYANLSGTGASVDLMNNLLTTEALALYPPSVENGETVYPTAFQDVAAHIAAAFPPAGAVTPTPNAMPAGITGAVGAAPDMLLVSLANPARCALPAATDAAAVAALDQYLLNAVPLLGTIQQILADKLNVVPPSGIMAGIWSLNDAQRGVWNAPANFALNEILAPQVLLDDDQQGGFNMPLNGNAINILRAMVNRGTVVWGARTLDGNSLDYRYIQVRRTLIYIEQSIKLALEQFAFAPNDGGTWATVIAAVSNFLAQVWQAGGLMGDKASDAFTVRCGVPTTMSGLDVLNGYMIVNVTLQMIHPAEFIELTFTQTMQGV